MAEPEAKNLIVKLVDWVIDRLERTWFFGLKFQLPSKFVSPFGFLGMLTFVTFLVLGVSGAFLMLYYVPTIDRAYDTVKLINDEVPYGLAMRNIHYHASNAMVFLAVLHLYYQYFSGRFKIKNEMIWVTGVMLGLLTVLEAFTGYDIIFNERAQLAISIGASLADASPVIGPTLRLAVFGEGFGDFIIRLYSLHVFIIPIIMILVMILHFPRYLVLDIPIVSAIVGGILMVGGLFPIDLGIKFEPAKPPLPTVPEWYLTGIYAFIRTGYDRFVTGGLLPALFLLMFFVIPFVDKSRKFTWKDRPFFTALAVTSVGQAIVTTVWGFYINPDVEMEIFERIFIDPVPFYSALLAITAISFGITYSFIKYLKVKEAAARARAKLAARSPATRPRPTFLDRKWVAIIIIALIGLQVFLNGLALQAYANGFRNLALFEVGAVLVTFSLIMHLYRFSKQLRLAAAVVPRASPGT